MKQKFTLWLEHEALSENNVWDLDDEFINASITLADGRRYALSIWTYKNVATQISEARKDGSGLNGKYLMGPDLLVERLDRPTLESVFAELVDSGCLRPEWEVLPDGGIRISKSILWEKNSPRLGDLLAFLEHHDQLCRNKDLADFVQMTRGGFLDLNGLNATDFNGLAEAILDFYSRFDAFSFMELYSCTSLVVLLTEDLRISSPIKLRAMELVSKYRSTFKTRIAARERRLARHKDAQQKESNEK